ncbi:MAG: Asp-tRNA(Asn)/Glu-tRNA(Gln) amidotransferase GatCAB subunit C [Candidatus Moranbacteria bacterium CG08_land_8_20_14_0_20_34_16]|nr:MAG: Asp-tRNA(Asn)/Glu-tRNA(Gln) amidotransferase GatCAB subunit C [Candidatus Moranbacteria bacterium CG08_land_8_20_14_0_20_34_16]
MISKEETKHIAGLARIGLSENEREKMSEDLSAILDWMKILQRADVLAVSLMEHITGLENSARGDQVEIFEKSEKLVKLFPENKNGFDKVKSVL